MSRDVETIFGVYSVTFGNYAIHKPVRAASGEAAVRLTKEALAKPKATNDLDFTGGETEWGYYRRRNFRGKWKPA